MIRTARLLLVPATPALVGAELEVPSRLATELEVDLPADWPPEHHDTGFLEHTLRSLSGSSVDGWGLHCVVWTADEPRLVVGSCGYKGSPASPSATVEVGYSVVPSWQRRGTATEAVGALIDAAWERGAGRVIAHTLPGLEASLGVLAKLGFAPTPSIEPGAIGFELVRPPF